jgi:hypothetical protein
VLPVRIGSLERYSLIGELAAAPVAKPVVSHTKSSPPTSVQTTTGA